MSRMLLVCALLVRRSKRENLFDNLQFVERMTWKSLKELATN